MFDQILDIVKQHLGNNPQVNAAIPAEQQDQVHKEIATQITHTLAADHTAQPDSGGVGGILSRLQGSMAEGSTLTRAIEGGVVGSLASKFGLPPMVTGAIAGALPGILQKFMSKVNDPTDKSITPDSLTQSLSSGTALGNSFGK